MVLRNKTYEHDANVGTWQLCLVLRRSCEKNLVDWTRKVAKSRPPHSDGFRFGCLRRSCGLLSGDEELTQQDENITQVEQTSNNLKLPEVDNSAQPETDSQMFSNQIIQETFTTKRVNNDSAETMNSVDIPNAQAQKYNQIPNTQSSNPETEDTYVDYRVTHVQGRGNKEEPQTSVDGAYSLVANSLKLSTV